MPRLWVVWFPWIVPLVGLVACDLVVVLSILLSLVAFARVVGGVWFVSPFPRVRAWLSLVVLHVGLYVGSGLMLVVSCVVVGAFSSF